MDAHRPAKWHRQCGSGADHCDSRRLFAIAHRPDVRSASDREHGTMRRYRRHAGLTLIELVLAMLLVVTLSTAIGYAFVAGLDMQRAHALRAAAQDRTEAMRRRLTQMLQSAKLTNVTTDPTTFFLGRTTGQTDTGDLGCDQLTFTTTAPGVPISAQSSEDDFE